MFYEFLDQYQHLTEMGFKSADAFIAVASDVLEKGYETDSIDEALNFLLSLSKNNTVNPCPCGKNCTG